MAVFICLFVFLAVRLPWSFLCFGSLSFGLESSMHPLIFNQSTDQCSFIGVFHSVLRSSFLLKEFLFLCGHVVPCLYLSGFHIFDLIQLFYQTPNIIFILQDYVFYSIFFQFLRMIYFIDVKFLVGVGAHMCTWMQYLWRAERGSTGSCELLIISAKNQTPIFCRNSKCS